MARHVVLLRGVNLGSQNRIAMAELREALAAAGFGDVATYVQSGNAVVTSDAPPAEVARRVAELLRGRFGVDVPVAVRTREELAAVVARNPLGDVADDPRRYQVTFLAEPAAPAAVERLEALAAGGERVVADGRELYTWHPDGIGRSRLGAGVAGAGAGATSRNWRTVEALLELAG